MAVLILGAAGLAAFATVLADKNRELDAKNSELTNKNRILDAKDAENRAVLMFFQNNVLAAARPEDQDGGLGIHATVRAAVDAAESTIANSFASQPMVEASIRDTLGQSYLNLGEPALAIRQLERTVAIRRSALGPDHADTLHSAINLARAYQEAGRLAEALSLYRETLERCNSRLGPDHPDTLIAMNDLGCAYRGAGRYPEAVALLEDTLKRRQTKVGPDDPDKLVSLNNLATTYQDAGQFDRALPLLEETLKGQQAARGPNHPDTLIAMNNLARAYQATGQLDKALPLYQEALKRQQAQIGPDHPDTLISMGNLATLYRMVGRLADALPLHEETLKRCKARLGPDHPDTLRAMSNLASAYRSAGRLAEALPLLEETHKRRRDTLGPEHPDTLLSMNTLARAYMVDHPARAESLARAALALREKQSPDDWLTFETRSLLGGGLLGQKKYAEAEPLLLQSYEGMKAREPKIPAHLKKVVPEAGANRRALRRLGQESQGRRMEETAGATRRCRQADPLTSVRRAVADGYRSADTITNEQPPNVGSPSKLTAACPGVPRSAPQSNGEPERPQPTARLVEVCTSDCWQKRIQDRFDQFVQKITRGTEPAEVRLIIEREEKSEAVP